MLLINILVEIILMFFLHIGIGRNSWSNATYRWNCFKNNCFTNAMHPNIFKFINITFEKGDKIFKTSNGLCLIRINMTLQHSTSHLRTVVKRSTSDHFYSTTSTVHSTYVAFISHATTLSSSTLLQAKILSDDTTTWTRPSRTTRIRTLAKGLRSSTVYHRVASLHHY